MKRKIVLPALALFCGLSSPNFAQIAPVPPLMNFQGRLAKPDGSPVPDGTYSVRFSFWTAASAGAEKWSQTANPVTVRKGVFGVLLADLSPDLFKDNLWLEIKVGNDPALTPRQPLVSVGYAMKASTVADGSITGASIQNGTLTADKFASSFLNPLAWLLNGNSGTNSGSQFLGTTDYTDLSFRTANVERMKINRDGDVKILGGNLVIRYGATPTYNDSQGVILRVFGGGFPAWQGGAAFGNTNATVIMGELNNVATIGGHNTNLSTWQNLAINTGGGNVGIGTGEPQSKLDVNGNSIIRGGFRVLLPDGGGHLTLTNDPNDNKIYFQGANSTDNGSASEILITGPGNTAFPKFTVQAGFSYFGGNAYVDGTLTTKEVQVVGSDVAEPYHIAPVQGIKPAPGIVVTIDPRSPGHLKVSKSAYDRTVAGIISGANGVKPGLILRQPGTLADGNLPVASSGRVYCWCDADANGSIRPGDLLTTSSTPGHAMKVTRFSKAQGAILGKAMSPLSKGKGLVLVLVTLQ